MLDIVVGVFLSAIPLFLIGAVVLQIVALRNFTGGWRVAALVPVWTMGAAVAVAVLGVLAGSDLAPIWVVLALPPCFLWVFGMWVLRAVAR
jgi:hypothetical protein